MIWLKQRLEDFPPQPYFGKWKPSGTPVGEYIREMRKDKFMQRHFLPARLRLRNHDKRRRWWS